MFRRSPSRRRRHLLHSFAWFSFRLLFEASPAHSAWPRPTGPERFLKSKPTEPMTELGRSGQRDRESRCSYASFKSPSYSSPLPESNLDGSIGWEMYFLSSGDHVHVKRAACAIESQNDSERPRDSPQCGADETETNAATHHPPGKVIAKVIVIRRHTLPPFCKAVSIAVIAGATGHQQCDCRSDESSFRLCDRHSAFLIQLNIAHVPTVHFDALDATLHL